ncbi:LAQU0S24e00386g1_1 [Lachancea quebecensis]|uniref:LAQU0S24e00386g1_1 n=1 Tax=Lachancea quebecensis TaxID=1654605 RepID=A0A0P1L541_9SACH|nr:LAQU0S24e00386g1_1 [Lachancea quebecensis]
MDKFDRQLRLWGKHGQQVLSKAQICIVGSTLLASEILKNLVLPGATKFHLIKENSYVKLNSFLNVEDLKSLNESADFEEEIWDADLMGNQEYWQHFDLIILTTRKKLLRDKLTCLSIPPMLVCSWNEFDGYVSFVSQEPHFVIESHRQHKFPDLRLDKPPQPILDFYESIKPSQLNQEQLSSLPFAVIIYHVLKSLNRSHVKVNRSSLRSEIRKLHNKVMPGSECLNFIEAERYSYLGLQNSQKIPDNVLECISLASPEPAVTFNSMFTGLVSSLKEYLKHPSSERQLPLSGVIPDMESSSEMYNAIQKAYLRRAAKDLNLFAEIAASHTTGIPFSHVKLFCNNVQNVRAVKTAVRIPTEEDCSSVEKSNPAAATILRKLINSNADIEATDLSCDKSQIELRYYPACSLLAGIVAQEAVKIVTHQFVPNENTLIYDGKAGQVYTAKL